MQPPASGLYPRPKTTATEKDVAAVIEARKYGEALDSIL